MPFCSECGSPHSLLATVRHGKAMERLRTTSPFDHLGALPLIIFAPQKPQ
jgi:hypothetical protein